MRRSYRFRLYPTRRQREALDVQLRACCGLYNAALEQRRDMWRNHGVSVGYHEQSAELRQLRAEGLLPADANFWCQQEVLRRLDRAFEGFFRRCARGETPGFPRFRSASRFDTLAFSFSGNAGGVAIRDRRLYLQGVGCLKVKWHRELPAGSRLRQVQVTRRHGGRGGFRFYACIELELPVRELPKHRGPAVGVDIGVRCFARLSNGTPIDALNPERAAARKRRRLERALARARKRSSRRRKAAARLARHREREAARRADYAHKHSRRLATTFSLIAVEELAIANMLRSAKGTLDHPGTGIAQKTALNRAIRDQGWGRFVQMLAYKAEEAGGRVVAVDPRASSQECCRCRCRDRRNRRGPRFRCTACGHADDADTNAAEVLLIRAVEKLEQEREQDQGPGRGLQARTPASAGVA